MGAAMVLAMAPDVPPRTKSLRTLFQPEPLLEVLPPWCAISNNQLNNILFYFISAIQRTCINMITFFTRRPPIQIYSSLGLSYFPLFQNISYSCKKNYNLFMWWPFKTKKQLDVQRTYIRVEFLTPEQKRIKKQTIQKLEKQYMNDQEQIIPYDGSFSVSFKFLMNTSTIAGTQQPIKNKMILNEFICHLQVTKNSQLADFMSTYVKEIQLYIHNGSMVSRNQVIPLYSQIETSTYRPEDVLQIIYQQRSLWERIKNRTKKIVKEVPKTIFGIFSSIFKVILGYFGFGGYSSILWKVLPTTSIMQWGLAAISMYFPIFTPLLALGKFLL